MNFKLNDYNTFIKENWSGDGINIFDVDDTIICTNAKIHVYDPIKKENFTLSTEEYNDFENKKHFQMDFTDFDDIEIMRKGIIVDWVFTILKKTMIMGKAVGIITARSDAKMIRQFFLEHGIDINPNFIFAVGGTKTTKTIAELKLDSFKTLINYGFKRFQYFDDDLKNIAIAKTLENEYSNVNVVTKHIKKKWLSQLKNKLKEIKK
jgi:acetylglutamate synthase